MRISDEHLRGRTVISSDGKALGEIVTLFLDNATWVVEALDVKLRNEAADEIGANRGIFKLKAATLEIPVRMIQSVGDAVVLSVALQGLRKLLPGGDS